MGEVFDENTRNCLDDNLETRREKMAQDVDELRHFCLQIARFPNDVKNVIEMHFSRAIISQLTYKIYAESFLVIKNILEYRYLNSQYLVGENYDEIYEVWNNYRENVSIMIKTIDGLVKTNFFSENDYSDPSWHLIYKDLYWKNVSIPMIKLEHELSTMNGNGLLQVLSETLLVIRELVDKLKNDFLFIKEDEFDIIYEANHLLYKRDYWPSEGRNFRQNVENNYLRNADNRIEELKRLLREEKNDFVHSQVGRIWRDFFVDKKELYQRMKNDGINEEQWKYFFQHICRFEEYEKWIEELKHPAPISQGLISFVIRPEMGVDVVNRIRELVIPKSKPKDVMMPIRAAIDAGVIERPNWESFVYEFGEDKLKSKTSFSEYTNPDKNHYITNGFQSLVEEFKQMLKA